MRIGLIFPARELNSRIGRAAARALEAAGEAGVSAVREQMLTGYDQPVMDTGALRDSITFAADGRTVRIGTAVPYAEPVHNGTARTPGRPFLTDGLMGAQDKIRTAMADALSSALL
ncbi:MAG: hypothetical protein IJ507_05580 [Clostridia bacterium]|nr:hypothetical protein [Clostridia bacterium]